MNGKEPAHEDFARFKRTYIGIWMDILDWLKWKWLDDLCRKRGWYWLNLPLDGPSRLLDAAASGRLDTVPDTYVTEQTLRLPHGSNGHTILHEVVRNYHFSKVPARCLSSENLLAKDDHGTTPLHLLAGYGQLKRLPPHLLTEEALTAPNTAGDTPLIWAAKNGYLDQIPATFITEENLRVDPDTLFEIIDQAAANGHLDRLPASMLTEKNLTLKDSETLGTPLHRAANGHLDQVPVDVLKAENLMLRDHEGASPLFMAAAFGYVTQIPKDCLPVERLTEQHNLTGPVWDSMSASTPLEALIEEGHLDQLLGIELPEEARKIVGEEWWARNQEILKRRAKAGESRDDPGSPAAGVEVDLG